jgi:hypothetical protein
MFLNIYNNYKFFMFKRNLDNPLETLNIGKITLIKNWLCENCSNFVDLNDILINEDLTISCNNLL